MIDFAKLLNSTKPVEFCLRYKDREEKIIWAVSDPLKNTQTAVRFWVGNGAWWGFLFESGLILDSQGKTIVDNGGAIIYDPMPFPGGSFVSFPNSHRYDDETPHDEIPF